MGLSYLIMAILTVLIGFLWLTGLINYRKSQAKSADRLRGFLQAKADYVNKINREKLPCKTK